MSNQKTTERAITCPHCRYYGLPNVVKIMGGRRVELYCFRCGNIIRVRYNSRKQAREENQR